MDRNVNTISYVSLLSLFVASAKLSLNLQIQFYLNNVTDPHWLTSHNTTACLTTWRSYRDHRLLWRHFTLCITKVLLKWSSDGFLVYCLILCYVCLD